MEEQLQTLKKEINHLLKEFFLKKQKEAKKLSPWYSRLVDQIVKITLSGGKRLRPALVYYGFKAYQSLKINDCDKTLLEHDFVTAKDLEKEILKISLTVELFHTACLIHDDIMDNAQYRHGVQTVHKYFEEYFKRHSDLSRINPLHDSGVALRAPQNDEKGELPRNLAILAGDLVLIWSEEILTKCQKEFVLPPKVREIYDQLREEVIFGQTLDVIKVQPCTRSHLLKMYTYKTAKYSFERPLQLGAALAGADEKVLRQLSRYAIPAGIAFQIQDDILEIFGKNLDKDADSDLKEGKETLLIAMSKLKIKNSKIKNKLENILGNKNATREDLEWARNLIKETGALKSCQKKAQKLVLEAKESLQNSSVSLETKNFLLWLADFCLSRKY